MKKILLIPLFLSFGICFSQVGIGTSTPRGALDINKPTTNEFGLVLPTNSSTGNIKNPQGGSVALGTMIYDSAEDCVKIYKSTGWSSCLCDDCISSLDCSNGELTGTYKEGMPSNGSKVINYVGDGQSYGAINVASTGVTGLNAKAPAGILANGNGSLTLSIDGVPNSSGTASFTINLKGQSCTFTISVTKVDLITVIQIGAGPTYFPNGVSLIGTDATNGGTGTGNAVGPGMTSDLIQQVLSDLNVKAPVEILGLVPSNNSLQGLTKIFNNTTSDGKQREVVFMYSGYNNVNQSLTSAINNLVNQQYVSKNKIYLVSADEDAFTTFPYFSSNNYGKTNSYKPIYSIDGTKLVETGDSFPTVYGNVNSSGDLSSQYWGNSVIPPTNAVIVSNIISSNTAGTNGAPIIFKDMNFNNGKVWVFGDTDAYWQYDTATFGAQPYLTNSCSSNDRQKFTCNMFNYIIRKNLGLSTQ